MGVPVSRQPPRAVSTSLVVGAPASASPVAALSNAAAFVHGRATTLVSASQFLRAHSGTAQTFVVYQRRLGVQALRVVSELYQGTGLTDRQTVEVLDTILAGVGTLPTPPWHKGPGDLPLDGKMDGATAIPAPSSVLPDYPRHEGFLDVSDLTVGLPVVLVVEVKSASGVTNGMRGLSIAEVPLPALDPVSSPAYEPGVDAAWTQGGNLIVDGSAGSPRGVGRIIQQLERGRTHCPLHWQAARHSGLPWTRTGASFAALGLETVRIRPRAYEGPSGDCRVRLGVVYRYTDSAGGTPTLRLTATSVTTGTVETTDLPVSDTGGDWYYDEINGVLPCDGSDQRVELAFTAKTNASDTLEVATLALLGRTV